jgi:hypothetical protein
MYSFVELTYFFNDNKEKKNVSVSYKASFCGSPPHPQTKLLGNQLKNKDYSVNFARKYQRSDEKILRSKQ